jgi:hypothetical protein
LTFTRTSFGGGDLIPFDVPITNLVPQKMSEGLGTKVSGVVTTPQCVIDEFLDTLSPLAYALVPGSDVELAWA